MRVMCAIAFGLMCAAFIAVAALLAGQGQYMAMVLCGGMALFAGYISVYHMRPTLRRSGGQS